MVFDAHGRWILKATPTYLLESLSNNDVTFFIPPYQRNYEWSTDTCKVLFDDIQRVTEANTKGVRDEHFFGSIVYVVEDAGFGRPSKFVLTDGQQRITTTMLFLMALRDSIDDEAYRDTIQSRFLQNDRAGDDTEYKIKLKQVESDWDAYKHLALGQDVSSSLRNSTVYQNYQFFRRQIRATPVHQRKDLLEKGLMKFSTISIELEPDRNPWENPQEIFESMNSLGKPLSLADLTRNYLLMGKTSRQQTALYNNFWLTLEKRLPGKLSQFIRDWMQADQHRSYKVARENNYKELYSAFKGIASGRTVEELFEDFVRFSEPYAIALGLETSGRAEIDQVIFDLNVIGVVPAYSYLAELVAAWKSGGFSDSQMAGLLSTLRTYLLRRRVLGLTKAENKFFPALGGRINALVRSEDPVGALFRQLSSQEYALRVPNDDELRLGLETMNFYNLGRSRNYPKLLLSLTEELLTKSRPAWDDTHLQLEHIMPQTLNRAWREDLGEDANEVHQEYLNNLGNVTLIRHNQELGNQPFSRKKLVYAGRSGLQVAQNHVIGHESWDAAAIRDRRDYLIGLISENVLGLPDSFKRANNWKQSGSSDTKFSSREVLNQLVGETIRYIDNESLKARVISDSQVEFEGTLWHLSPLTRHLKERDKRANLSGAYQGAMYWTWDGVRLVDLDF